MKDYSILNTPVKIGGIVVKNRYALAPMTGGATNNLDSSYTKTAINYFSLRAKGGFGLIIPGALSPDSIVDAYSPLGPDPLKNKEFFIPKAKELVAQIHKYDSKIFCQISMGLGRNYPNLGSPSENVVFNSSEKSPELTIEQIKIKIQQIVDFSIIAKEAGYDGVEIHAMHWGYLLDQFATSIFNKRLDEYGGSLENKLRAAKEIVEGIHKACGDSFPVSMRFSLASFIKAVNDGALTDEEEHGRSLAESLECAKLLEKYGYDMLNVDVGTYESFYYACPPNYVSQGFMLPFIKDIKKYVTIPVFVGGRMNDPNDALAVIYNGLADGISIGRPSLADAELPKKVFEGKIASIRPCIACNMGCLSRLLDEGKPACCAVNPTAMRELEYGLRPLKKSLKIMVIGGGVSGMEFARTATLRGHKVILYEKSNRLGGHLNEAGAHCFKKEVSSLNKWYQNELKRLNIETYLNQEITDDMLNNSEFDEFVIATGSRPKDLSIKGVEYAINSLEAINRHNSLGERIIVVGGGLAGCEIALEAAMTGRNVTILEARDHILSSGFNIPLPNKMMLKKLFTKYNVKIKTAIVLKEIKPNGVIVASEEKEFFIEAKNVILATGFKPYNPFKNAKYVLGDAKNAKTIMNAIWDAYDLANKI